MTRSDIEHLGSIRGYPAISILMPTRRGSPENRQNAIRLKTLIHQTTERLLTEFSRRDIEPLLKRLEISADEVDPRSILDGLALFVNQDIARVLYLPFPVKERVVVDETFAIRDLGCGATP